MSEGYFIKDFQDALPRSKVYECNHAETNQWGGWPMGFFFCSFFLLDSDPKRTMSCRRQGIYICPSMCSNCPSHSSLVQLSVRLSVLFKESRREALEGPWRGWKSGESKLDGHRYGMILFGPWSLASNHHQVKLSFYKPFLLGSWWSKSLFK